MDSSKFGESISIHARTKLDREEPLSVDDALKLKYRFSLIKFALISSARTAVDKAEVVAKINIGYALQTITSSREENIRICAQFNARSACELNFDSKALGQGTLNSLDSEQDSQYYS